MRSIFARLDDKHKCLEIFENFFEILENFSQIFQKMSLENCKNALL